MIAKSDTHLHPADVRQLELNLRSLSRGDPLDGLRHPVAGYRRTVFRHNRAAPGIRHSNLDFHRFALEVDRPRRTGADHSQHRLPATPPGFESTRVCGLPAPLHTIGQLAEVELHRRVAALSRYCRQISACDRVRDRIAPRVKSLHRHGAARPAGSYDQHTVDPGHCRALRQGALIHGYQHRIAEHCPVVAGVVRLARVCLEHHRDFPRPGPVQRCDERFPGALFQGDVHQRLIVHAHLEAHPVRRVLLIFPVKPI